jgi:hypothetical protein
VNRIERPEERPLEGTGTSVRVSTMIRTISSMAIMIFSSRSPSTFEGYSEAIRRAVRVTSVSAMSDDTTSQESMYSASNSLPSSSNASLPIADESR